MREHVTSAEKYWNELERNVTSKVDTALNDGHSPRGPLISYLRDLEASVRTKLGYRQTIQIIASGRRLLGDRSQIGSDRGPFAHAAGWRNTFPLRQTSTA